jgi:hypothetical protein
MAGQHLDKVTQGKSTNKKTDSHDLEHQHRPFRLEDADVMDLQRHLGNQATQNVLGIQRKPAGLPSLPGVIQTKMNVNEPGDQYEQEADAVAHEVMTMPDPVQRAESTELEEEEMAMTKRISDVQRAGLEEEEIATKRISDIQRVGMEDEEMLQGKHDIQREGMPEEEMELAQGKHLADVQRDGMGVPPVTEDMEGQINSAKGSGQSINEETRSFLEPRFGQDFSDVRIHTGAESDNLNNNLQAKAFTTGNDIFFRDGDYNPNSSDGRELLAHELTHVVQQGGSKDLKTKHDDECCS